MQFSDLQAKVGQGIGTSEWVLVDQARIDAFAEVSEDHQFIHVNPELAKATPFGRTIAHGFLTVSLLSKMMATAVERPAARMSVNYGFDKLRFLTPVKSGQRIRGHFKLLEMVEKRPGQWQQKVEATVEIEGEEIENGGKPAMIAEWLFQHFA
jgi:acyl dehydratase